MNLQEYAKTFEESDLLFERSVEEYGLPFEKTESSPRSKRFRVSEACGCHCENGGFSLWRNWLSPACKACRTGERTGSLFIDLNCTKDCYFCFNANQSHYEHFRSHKRNIELELEQAHAAGARYDCLAVTGGEPLLHKEKVTSFVRRAKELYPRAHVRLYTNGDLVDAQVVSALAKSGLDEIRFSVKPADFDSMQENAFAAMELAVAAIPDVVIEMPVLPGSLEDMKALMKRADAIGVRCINLLEFGFPLCRADEFAKRGFELRRRPYKYSYDYWYSGGVPIAGSESVALTLLEFASAENLAMGVHYCSVDNRNSAQICSQNRPFSVDSELRESLPWMELDEDHFLKCAKAFGDDALRLREWASASCVAHYFDEEVPSTAIATSAVDDAFAALPDLQLGESAYVIESRDDAGPIRIREIAVREMPRP